MTTKPLIYIGGSMSNRPGILAASLELRGHGLRVFNDWIMPGEETDMKWREFEEAQGNDFFTALDGKHAQDVFDFDKRNLDAAAAFLLVLPAGRSAHIELGYMSGRCKPTFVLMPEQPDRWDVMYQFATLVTPRMEDIVAWCKHGI